MAMMEDEDVQTKGVVEVAYMIGMPGLPREVLTLIRDGAHVFTNFPSKRCGFHLCYNNDNLKAVFSFLHSIVSREVQVRERYHYGSHLEIQYALRSFGIHFGLLPTKRQIEDYIDMRRAKDEEWKRIDAQAEKDANCILYPREKDVLVGRGKPYQEFVGNMRLATLVGTYTERFKALTDRLEKTLLSLEIVKDVQMQGTRFLKRTEAGWEVVDDTVAREKVVQALRVRAKKQRDEENMGEAPAKRVRGLNWG